MTAPISRRARRVTAPTYDDFPLDHGDTDLRADTCQPPSWLRDLHARAQIDAADLVSYGPVQGLPDLRERLGADFGVSRDTVVITAGASEALHLALTCVADPGDAVALPRPAFPGYDELAALLGLRIAHYDASGRTDESVGDHHATVPDGEGASVVAKVICTPHNPTGAVVPRTSPADGDAADRWTIWDLSHAALPATDSPQHSPSGLFRAGLRSNEIVIFSLSKLLRLPGARIGCLITTDPRLVDTVIRVKTHQSMSTGRPSQILAGRLLSDPQARADIAAHHEVLAGRRNIFQQAVSASRCLAAPAAGGGSHLMLHSLDASDPWNLLKSAGLVGLPGTVFHSPTPAVRICTAQPGAVVQAAAETIAGL